MNIRPQPTRAVVYVRSGYTVVQELLTRALAAVHGYDVTAVVKDPGLSVEPRHADRPGLHRALMMIENGEADVIVTDRLTTVTRRVSKLRSFSARGIKIVAAGT